MANRGLQLAAYLCIRYNDIDVFMILLPTIPICEPLANGLTLLEEATSRNDSSIDSIRSYISAMSITSKRKGASK
jgi:hypothetical protein